MEFVWEALQTATTAAAAAVSAFCPVQLLPAAGEEFEVGGRRYRALKQLGEGGYAFVHLAQEAGAGEPVAVKRILAGSSEKLAEAKREIAVLQALSHANCLPLLHHAINTRGPGGGGSRAAEVLLVFPAYQDGTLLDELDRLALDSRKLSTCDVLDIFRQVCAGTNHMHSRGFAHLDIKPQNVLLRRPSSGSSSRRKPQLHTPPLAAGRQQPAAAARERLRLSDWGGAGGDSEAPADLEAGIRLVSRDHYVAVLTDFGSARQMPIRVDSRAHALAVQEDAEAHSTATYRAPELFDVPSHCTLSAKVDVWALGSTLYAMMYGASPFQHALDQGASLALAVMNCRIPWSAAIKPGSLRYPEPLHQLVNFCLSVDPERRPTVAQVLARVSELASCPDGLADPFPAAG